MAECKGTMTRRNPYLFGALALGLFAALPAAHAASGSSSALDRNRELQACAAKAEANPDGAKADAKRWQERGGGDHAKLCEALALFHAGDFKAAGTQMEALVPTLEAAFKGGGVHLVDCPIDYSENTRVLVEELRNKVPDVDLA